MPGIFREINCSLFGSPLAENWADFKLHTYIAGDGIGLVHSTYVIFDIFKVISLNYLIEKNLDRARTTQRFSCSKSGF